MQTNESRREALEKHIGACVILCQCIEHSLAMLTRGRHDLHLLKGEEFFEALAKPHSMTLESHFNALMADHRFGDILPEFAAIIERRNRIVHRAIVSCEVIAYFKGEADYDFEADLAAFRAFLSVVTQRMDLHKIGAAPNLDEALLTQVHTAHILAIEKNRSIAAKTRANRAAKASGAQRT